MLIRWDGAQRPEVWTVPAPRADPGAARLELARRYLHVYGPATPESFGQWAGVGTRPAVAVFAALRGSLTKVRTPIGEGWILVQDETAVRTAASPPAAARLLPSGDAYFLLQEPTATCWSQTPASARRYGRRGSGPAPSWSAVRSPGRGGVPARC